MALDRCYNIEDVRQAARRRLPRGVFEFIDRSTEDDLALMRNRAGFRRLQIAPRPLVDVAQRSTEATLLGKRFSMPVAVAPAGPAGLLWYRGELALAKAAASANVPFSLSAYSTTAMEEIAATGATVWQQLYFWRDRGLTDAIVSRARELGFAALVVTVDTPVLGQREHLQRARFLPPFGPSLGAYVDMLLHPRWLSSVALRYLTGPGLPRVVNLPPRPADRAGREAYAARTTLCPSVTWDDMTRLRDTWPGKLAIKGILRADAALKAAEIGVDAVIVSNHGGRNLDSSVAPIEVLAAIVDAAGDRVEVLMDSGIRRGSDILKALALGARGVLAGRPALYGVAAAGMDGALHALGLLQSELDRTMALSGCTSLADIGPDLIASSRHVIEGSRS